MFERFTDRARRVVVLSQEEARLLNHNYIGTEHILLGLVHEGDGVAAKALERLDISLTAVRTQVEEIIGRGGQAPSGHIPFTPRAKKVLENALREALQLGHNYIGTEHILLGLIREGEGVAAQVLEHLGADLGRVRQQVIELLGGDPVEHAGPSKFTVIAPASCSFCSTPSPECGTLFVGSRGALICEHCVAIAAGRGRRGSVDSTRTATTEPSSESIPSTREPPVAGKVASGTRERHSRASEQRGRVTTTVETGRSAVVPRDCPPARTTRVSLRAGVSMQHVRRRTGSSRSTCRVTR